MINQLFIEKPPESIILASILTLGWLSFTDKRVLSRFELDRQQIADKFTHILNDLRQYYLPCKQDKYLTNYNTKSVITIVRQLLKTIGYNIRGIERVIDNKKEMIYKLEPYNKVQVIQPNKIQNTHQNTPINNSANTNNMITTHTSQSKFIVCWN
jgi:hypothetical protein